MKYIFSFSLILLQSFLYSQVTLPDQVGRQINSLSPQTFEFMHYGNTDESLFTGETNIKIPIYKYEDNDFILPIYLGYNSSGFVPNKREGIVGLNWYLNIGGAITRKVNNFPDEKEGHPNDIPTTLHGLYYGIINNLGVKYKEKSCIFNFESGCSSVTSLTDYWNIDGCEVDPDEFSFNMPGFSGKFFFQNNGDVKCLGSKPYKVDLSQFSTQPDSETDINDSEIKIITDDGYEYYFGGGIQNIEVSYTLDTQGTFYDPKYPVINAWHLRKIVAPDGHEVVFNYRNFEPGFHPHYPLDSEHYLLNLYDVNYVTIEETCNSVMGDPCTNSSSAGTVTVEEINKTVYLENITIDNVKIEFNYSEKEFLFYQDEVHGYNQKTLKLDSIKIYYQEELIPGKMFSFTFDYKGPDLAKRLFLTSYTKQGENPYTFDYYNTEGLPVPTTHGIDYWGYWNGKSANNELLPDINYYINGDIDYVSDEREPDPSYKDASLLHFIHYPTGGFTEYIYEGHDYSKRLERKNSSNFQPEIFDISDYAGGARIKRINDNDGANYTNEREFFYKKNYPELSSSSGILLDWPRMLYYWEHNFSSITQGYLQMKSVSYNKNICNFGESHIQYSEVVEKNVFDGSFTTYFFTNYETNPNYEDHGIFIVNSDLYENVSNLFLYNSYVDQGFNDRSFERGQLYHIKKYSAESGTSQLVYEKTTQFSEFDENTNNYIVGVYQTGSIAKSYKKYYYPFLPVLETEIVYSSEGTNSITTINEYIYNEQNLIQEKIIHKSEGDLFKKKYRYPTDLVYSAGQPSSSITWAMASMESKNMINYPVEIIDYLDNSIIKSQVNFYSLFYTDINFYQSFELEAENIIPEAEYTFLHFIPGFNGPPEIDERCKLKLSCDNYDSFGNILQFHLENDINNVFVWGYNYFYPIAKIENAIYSQVIAALDCSIQDLQTKTEVELRYIFNNLRENLYDAMITSYTYKPLVGMTSETDPAGKTTYYEYDAFGRLETIKDQDGNVTKHIDYNYIEENN